MRVCLRAHTGADGVWGEGKTRGARGGKGNSQGPHAHGDMYRHMRNKWMRVSSFLVRSPMSMSARALPTWSWRWDTCFFFCAVHAKVHPHSSPCGASRMHQFAVRGTHTGSSIVHEHETPPFPVRCPSPCVVAPLDHLRDSNSAEHSAGGACVR